MAEHIVGEMATILFMALAVSLDGFSVSLGIGMQQLRLKRIAIIGLVFGAFHFILPAMGMFLGNVLSGKVGHMATFAGGLLLTAIGAQMIFSSFNHEAKQIVNTDGIGLIIVALTVSIDSFSVGLGLGISGMRTTMTLIVFAVTSTSLAWLGMLLGKKVKGYLGAYSGMLGGSILSALGLVIMFS